MSGDEDGSIIISFRELFRAFGGDENRLTSIDVDWQQGMRYAYVFHKTTHDHFQTLEKRNLPRDVFYEVQRVGL